MTRGPSNIDYLGSTDAARADEAARGVEFDAEGGWGAWGPALKLWRVGDAAIRATLYLASEAHTELC